MTETPSNNLTLNVQGLTKFFGGLCAVKNFDINLQQGDLAGLIGPNGAGKTTVFNMVTGLYTPSGGEISFEGENVVGFEPFEITRMGIGRTFQNIRLFSNLTVLDNVRIAFHAHAGYSLVDGIMVNKLFTIKEIELTERAQDLLEIFPPRR